MKYNKTYIITETSIVNVLSKIDEIISHLSKYGDKYEYKLKIVKNNNKWKANININNEKKKTKGVKIFS
jgi:hypothetical protein